MLRKKSMLLVLALVAVLAFAGCSSDSTPGPDSEVAEEEIRVTVNRWATGDADKMAETMVDEVVVVDVDEDENLLKNADLADDYYTPKADIDVSSFEIAEIDDENGVVIGTINGLEDDGSNINQDLARLELNNSDNWEIEKIVAADDEEDIDDYLTDRAEYQPVREALVEFTKASSNANTDDLVEAIAPEDDDRNFVYDGDKYTRDEFVEVVVAKEDWGVELDIFEIEQFNPNEDDDELATADIKLKVDGEEFDANAVEFKFEAGYIAEIDAGVFGERTEIAEAKSAARDTINNFLIEYRNQDLDGLQDFLVDNEDNSFVQSIEEDVSKKVWNDEDYWQLDNTFDVREIAELDLVEEDDEIVGVTTDDDVKLEISATEEYLEDSPEKDIDLDLEFILELEQDDEWVAKVKNVEIDLDELFGPKKEDIDANLNRLEVLQDFVNYSEDLDSESLADLVVDTNTGDFDFTGAWDMTQEEFQAEIERREAYIWANSEDYTAEVEDWDTRIAELDDVDGIEDLEDELDRENYAREYATAHDLSDGEFYLGLTVDSNDNYGYSVQFDDAVIEGVYGLADGDIDNYFGDVWSADKEVIIADIDEALAEKEDETLEEQAADLLDDFFTAYRRQNFEDLEATLADTVELDGEEVEVSEIGQRVWNSEYWELGDSYNTLEGIDADSGNKDNGEVKFESVSFSIAPVGNQWNVKVVVSETMEIESIAVDMDTLFGDYEADAASAGETAISNFMDAYENREVGDLEATLGLQDGELNLDGKILNNLDEVGDYLTDTGDNYGTEWMYHWTEDDVEDEILAKEEIYFDGYYYDGDFYITSVDGDDVFGEVYEHRSYEEVMELKDEIIAAAEAYEYEYAETIENFFADYAAQEEEGFEDYFYADEDEEVDYYEDNDIARRDFTEEGVAWGDLHDIAVEYEYDYDEYDREEHKEDIYVYVATTDDEDDEVVENTLNYVGVSTDDSRIETIDNIEIERYTSSNNKYLTELAEEVLIGLERNEDGDWEINGFSNEDETLKAIFGSVISASNSSVDSVDNNEDGRTAEMKATVQDGTGDAIEELESGEFVAGRDFFVDEVDEGDDGKYIVTISTRWQDQYGLQEDVSVAIDSNDYADEVTIDEDLEFIISRVSEDNSSVEWSDNEDATATLTVDAQDGDEDALTDVNIFGDIVVRIEGEKVGLGFDYDYDEEEHTATVDTDVLEEAGITEDDLEEDGDDYKVTLDEIEVEIDDIVIDELEDKDVSGITID